MSRTYSTNPDWKRLSDEIVKPNQLILVLGATDSGKTTFSQYLIDTASDKSINSALVDADIGQSKIGPPTTIGMKLYVSYNDVTETALNQNDISKNEIVEQNRIERSFQSADSLYFVGALSPQRNLLPILTGTRLMVDAAQNSGADFIVVDTTGFVHESSAVILKQQKIDLIRPNHLVCLGRTKELERIVGCFKGLNCLKIHHLLPHKLTRVKTSPIRKNNRKLRFQEYFVDSKIQEISFEQIHGARTPFFKGRVANKREIEILMQLTEEEILYAEWGHRELALIARRRLSHNTTKKLKDYLSLSFVSVQNPAYFEHRIVGLVDDSGNTTGIGIIEAADFLNQEFKIRCHTDLVSKIKILQFGQYQYFDNL